MYKFLIHFYLPTSIIFILDVRASFLGVVLVQFVASNNLFFDFIKFKRVALGACCLIKEVIMERFVKSSKYVLIVFLLNIEAWN